VRVRAVTSLEIREAVVPPNFPMAPADRLRAEGVELFGIACDVFEAAGYATGPSGASASRTSWL
jgi:hypothetical protein